MSEVNHQPVNHPSGTDPANLRTDKPVRVNNTRRNIIIVVVVVVVVVVALAVFFGIRAANGADASDDAKGSESNPVKIGVVGATDPQWTLFKQKAEEAGIHVDIVDFQDYTSENPALDSGDLDLNEFQHLLYLANYNVKNDSDLQPIGATAVFPLGLYSSKVESLDDITEGSTVAIPNDETNQARALGVLKAAGLITLKGDWNAFSTPADVDTEGSKVKITPLKAEQVANSLGDPQVIAGVVNNDYVADAGLTPSDALYQDDAESEEARPYINVFASRKADINNETYLKVVEIFQSDDVLDKLKENSGGTAALANHYTAEELQGFLADIEKDVRAAQ